ncbi:ATPase associated with various cellular activities family protein, partial [Vibrio parahaemolyticus VP2007-007]
MLRYNFLLATSTDANYQIKQYRY